VVYSAQARGVFSLFLLPLSCKALRSGCARGMGWIGEVIIVILGVTFEFLVTISKHEIPRHLDRCW
jgi:hypothetical protein